ncbi:MAG: type II secretion system protein [Burkholderiales bacterium]|nr:type II secretion system protein [Burkholderiales bacterium]
MRRPRSAAGFSLIEVLAAFVILALVATALFRLFSASLTNASAAEEYSRALLVAESQLEAAAGAQPLRETSDRGTGASGRIRWESRVAFEVLPEIDPDLERASEALASRLYRITVDVSFEGSDGRERKLSLATVRMGPRNPV